MIKVSVPATTANLGPGFDCLGLALDIYNHFYFEKIDHVGVEFFGYEQRFQNNNNLCYKAFCATLASKDIIQMDGLRLGIKASIPVSRGLGSSASLIVAGVAGANLLYKLDLSLQDMLEIATSIEGHPDNVAPCIFGGLTASIMVANSPFTTSFEISEKIKICILVPDFELSTHAARSVLPKTVPYNDAIFNLSRSTALVGALQSGNEKLLSVALEDKLHQPFRKSLIPGYDEHEKIAKDCGAIGVCISGAGPSMLCFYTDPEFETRIKQKSKFKVLLPAINKSGVSIHE